MKLATGVLIGLLIPPVLRVVLEAWLHHLQNKYCTSDNCDIHGVW